MSHALVFGDWREEGSWEDSNFSGELQGRGSSGDIDRVGEQGVGGVLEPASSN